MACIGFYTNSIQNSIVGTQTEAIDCKFTQSSIDPATPLSIVHVNFSLSRYDVASLLTIKGQSLPLAEYLA
jgi:hypothetical protein